MTAFVVVFVVTVCLSALYSGLETGLYTTSRLRIYLDAEAGVRPARRAQTLLRQMPSLLSVLLVCNNLANWGASYAAQAVLIGIGVAHSELVGTAFVSVTLFLAAESVPKSAFRRGREHLLYPLFPVLWVSHMLLARVLSPITWFAQGLARGVRRRSGGGETADRDLVLRGGVAEGFLSGFQSRVADGVLAMRTRTAGDEARPLAAFATAQLGRAGVDLPVGTRDHRVLVLEGEEGRVLGWMPLAQLWSQDGFRSPRRAEVQPVARVEAREGLDRVYVDLDRTRAAFAILPDRRVVDANLLRQAVMGEAPWERP